jgi:hypothetical protein
VKIICRLLPLLGLAFVLLTSAGCGGIQATGSVSPASFFLPGLGQAPAQPVEPDLTLPESDSFVQTS